MNLILIDVRQILAVLFLFVLTYGIFIKSARKSKIYLIINILFEVPLCVLFAAQTGPHYVFSLVLGIFWGIFAIVDFITLLKLSKSG